MTRNEIGTLFLLRGRNMVGIWSEFGGNQSDSARIRSECVGEGKVLVRHPQPAQGPKRLVWALQVNFFFYFFFFVLTQTHSLHIPSAARTCHLSHDSHPYGTHSLHKGPKSRLGPTGK